ncbi:MAG: gamma-glutamylcyclotransferase [Nocardioidaceae bacterium]
MPLYAAYASNLEPLRMFERCPHSPARGTGWLVGWRLTFAGEELGWDGSLATIVEETGCQVFVALYDVSREDERLLTDWESDVYRKLHVRVQTLDGEQLAWVYVLDAYEGGLPSASYLSVISEAAAAAGAPDDYVSDLRHRPCRSIGG